MAKEKKIKKEEDGISKQTKYMSYFIILIMVFSIGGFAMLSGGGVSSNDSQSGQRNLPLQADVFQNPQTGETYWGAVLNGEQFIFFNGVQGYDQRQEMEKLAFDIKQNAFVNIYIDSNYSSSDSIYVVEKALTGLEIPFQRINGNLTCNSNTLVFTNDESFDNNCLVFYSAQGEEYLESDVLVYHLIK